MSEVHALLDNGYRAKAYLVPDVRQVMPVMGMRLFYGRRREGAGVVEFSLVGRSLAAAENRARELCDLLWEASLVGDAWEVDGEVLTITDKVDLSPDATTALAARWMRALS